MPPGAPTRPSSASPPPTPGSPPPSHSIPILTSQSPAERSQPRIPFAHALLSFYPPGAEIGLVPCAGGGSTLTDWARGSRLYSQLVRRTKESVYGGGCEIKAVIWFHGKSDALSEEATATAAYGSRMKKFIGDLRRPRFVDLRFDLGIGCNFVGDEGLVEKVREAQLGMDLTGVICVDSLGLQLNDDGIHLTTQGQIELGRMLTEAYVYNFVRPTQQ
ncbi:hypothetical protein IEQ34_008986 [Dendrobium chrysotoxum]|uniref:Sialate O-acetylesterase domain-containing protein n=1 Tax=Dendrobium chrysotoxum TaxID=161865 RepID=A0AAV7GXG7_DENCH|nr:hypothetical protein IEQ34_008986 [Dendrobium chrysotoxum]